MLFRIRNFQSIEEAEVVLDGFTAITGTTNVGKSALVRALRAWAYNEFAPGWVRTGAKECELTGEWPEGNAAGVRSVSFRKGPKENSYTVTFMDGRETKIPKAGTDTPDELKALGFRRLTTERDDDFNLNFQGQFEPLFLLADTPTTLTSFLNSIFDVAKYERALRGINSEILGLGRDYDDLSVKILQGQNRLADEEAELGANRAERDALAELKAEVLECDGRLERLDRAEKALALIADLEARVAAAASERERAGRLRISLGAAAEFSARAISAIRAADRVSGCEAGLRGVEEARRPLAGAWAALVSISAHSGRAAALGAVRARVESLDAERRLVSSRATVAKAICAAASRLPDAVQRFGTLAWTASNLSSRAESVAAVGRGRSSADCARDFIERVGVSVSAIRGIATAQARLAGSRDLLAESRARGGLAERDVEALRRARIYIEEKLGVCPACGRISDLDGVAGCGPSHVSGDGRGV